MISLKGTLEEPGTKHYSTRKNLPLRHQGRTALRAEDAPAVARSGVALVFGALAVGHWLQGPPSTAAGFRVAP